MFCNPDKMAIHVVLMTPLAIGLGPGCEGQSKTGFVLGTDKPSIN